jgi:hypothetical protein
MQRGRRSEHAAAAGRVSASCAVAPGEGEKSGLRRRVRWKLGACLAVKSDEKKISIPFYSRVLFFPSVSTESRFHPKFTRIYSVFHPV